MTIDRLRRIDPRVRLLGGGVILALLIVVGFGAFCMGSGDDDTDVIEGGDVPPAADYLDVIEQRVAAGEWTLEEGLVQTLKAFAGEAELEEVLQGREVLSAGGTPVVAAANDYLASGTNEDAKAEMSRLLDAIFLSPEELEPISSPLAAPWPSQQFVLNAPVDGLRTWNAPSPEEPFECDADPCFLFAEKQYGQAVFRIYLPAVYATGPEQALVNPVLEAIDDSVPVYSTFLPFTRSTNIVFATEAFPEALAVVWASDEQQTCPMTVYLPTIQAFEKSPETFKQTIAHELFHCYQQWNLPQASEVDYGCRRWWTEGTAEYFSNVVYPDVNDEWGFWWLWAGGAEANEGKGVSIVDRAYEDSLFFQFLANRIGDEDLIALIRTLPKSEEACRPSQAQALAAFPNMDELFHDFGKDFLGPGIKDRGGKTYVPEYDPEEIAVGSSTLNVTRSLGTMVLDWYTVVFPLPDREYSLQQQPKGTGKASGGQPRAPGWAGPVPKTVTACPENRVTIVLTATKPGYQHVLNVKEEDDEVCTSPTPIDLPSFPDPASSYGEPHLLTFDQLDYDFQAVGEFVLVRSTKDDFEIQVRQEPVEDTDSVSINGAVAMNVGGDTVGVYAGRDEPIVINGEAQPLLEGEVTLPNGGKLTGGDGSLLMRWRDGTEVKLDVGSFFINASVYLADRRAEEVEGLLGNANGDPTDDIATRDGEVIPADPDAYILPVMFADLYDVYGASWRIEEDESLFEYGPGESTATFTDEDFPAEPVDISGFSSAQQEKAEDDCKQAGVIDFDLLQDCIYDLLVSGKTEFALLAAKLDSTVRITETPGLSSSPRAAFDGAGTLHVIWIDETTAPGDVFHRSRNVLGQWSDPEKLSTSQPGDFTIGSAALLTGPDGNVCAFWAGGFRSAPYGLYSRCFTEGGWTAATLLQSGDFTAEFFPQFNEDGTIEVVQHDPPESVLFGDLELNPDGGLTDSVRFAIATDGSYHVLWQALPELFEAGARPQLLHTRSGDAGATWSEPEPVIEDMSGVTLGSLLPVADGGLFLDWTNDNIENVRLWTPGSGWGKSVAIEGLCCGFHTAVGGDDLLHIASIDNVTGDEGFQGRFGYAKPSGKSSWERWQIGYLPGEVDPEADALAVDADGQPHLIFGVEGDLYYTSLR